jgi:hypothetical protein
MNIIDCRFMLSITMEGQRGNVNNRLKFTSIFKYFRLISATQEFSRQSPPPPPGHSHYGISRKCVQWEQSYSRRTDRQN